MDKVIFLPSAMLGVLVVLFYLYRCHKAKKEVSQTVIVTAVLQASGIVCGVLLISGTFFDEAKALLKEIDLYIFISGLVIITNSIKTIYRDVFVSTSEESE